LTNRKKQAVGYLPEGFEKAAIGVSGKNTIAGGDIRIFRVRVEETGVEETSQTVPPPNPTGRFLPLRGMRKIEDEISSRPTFFQHFDGVSVDWKYLADREASTLLKEAGWLALQKVRVLVDLTSGINLFPDLRLVNNIEPEYRRSMESIRNVTTKMQALGAHDLLLSLHKPVENNITLPDTWKEFERLCERFVVMRNPVTLLFTFVLHPVTSCRATWMKRCSSLRGWALAICSSPRAQRC